MKLNLIITSKSLCPIFQHFVPRGTTVNTATYIAMLKKFKELHRDKRPERFGDEGEMAEEWFFHQDNAPVRILYLR